MKENMKNSNEYDHQLGIAINSMSQDDSTGTVYAMLRNDSVLKTVQFDSSMESLGDFLDKVSVLGEVIIFDGGNSHGDSWKWTFFPQVQKCVFVSETGSAGSVLIGDEVTVPSGDQADLIVQVMVPDLVGDYDDPEEVPEWEWILANASYGHTGNAQDGIWEFILNLSRDFVGIPEKLLPSIVEARRAGASYLLFHQGT